VLLVLIIPTVISFFFFWLSKRNERIKADLARYETLFGDEKNKAQDI